MGGLLHGETKPTRFLHSSTPWLQLSPRSSSACTSSRSQQRNLPPSKVCSLMSTHMSWRLETRLKSSSVYSKKIILCDTWFWNQKIAQHQMELIFQTRPVFFFNGPQDNMSPVRVLDMCCCIAATWSVPIWHSNETRYTTAKPSDTELHF